MVPVVARENRQSTNWCPRRVISSRWRPRCGEVSCSPASRRTRCSWGSRITLPLQNDPLRDAPRLLQIFRTLPGYLGAWPKPGFLDMLPLNLAGAPATEGMAQLLLGIWRWQGRGFSVLSMDPAILQEVDRQVGFAETDEPAQIRVRVGDLSNAQFRDWLDSWGYSRGQNATTGNARFLAILTQQLGVPQADALHRRSAIARRTVGLPTGRRIPIAGRPQFRDLEIDGRGGPGRRGIKYPRLTSLRHSTGSVASRPRSCDTPNESSCERMSTCSGRTASPLINLPSFDVFRKNQQDTPDDAAKDTAIRPPISPRHTSKWNPRPHSSWYFRLSKR